MENENIHKNFFREINLFDFTNFLKIIFFRIVLQDMLENQTENGKENVLCKKLLVLQDIMETLQEELNAKFVHVQILLIPISKKKFMDISFIC